MPRANTNPKIEIRNFLRMTPEVPQFNVDKNPNYLVSGANPTHYLDFPGIQEEQMAPLIASYNWNQISASLDGEIVAMIPASSNSANFTVFLMTSTSHVFGITASGGIPVSVTSLGFPDGGAHSGLLTGKLASFAGTLFAGVYLDSQIYRITSFSGPTWSSGMGSITLGVNTFFTTFLQYLTVTDGLGNVVKFDTSFTQSAGISLGTGWIITGTINYNDKYMAIAAVRTNSYDYTENYIFLWDGVSATYNYAMRIPGGYIDMEIIDSILWVAVSESSTKTSMYKMKNNFLVKEFTMPYSLISQAGFSFVPEDNHTLFNYMGKLGIRLTTNTDLTCPLLVYGDTPVGKESFIITSGNQFSNFCTGTDGLLYAAEYIPGGNGNLWYYPTTSTSYQPILYRSHWVRVHNPSGIDIRYALPPASATDQIQVTIYGRGEDIIAGSGIVTTALVTITNTNFLDFKRTRLDLLGFEGDFMKIELRTVNTETWRPVIRGIDII
jgi:hypothetical protein